MAVTLTEVGLTAIRRIADLWSAAKPDSLIDYTSVMRVEPIALVDQDALYYDGTPEVMQSMLSLFSGYYLQAVAASTQIGNIAVRTTLDKLNPNRSALGNAIDRAHTASGNILRMEAYDDRLPVPEEHEEQLALEAVEHYMPHGLGDHLSGKAQQHYRDARRRLSERSVAEELKRGNHNRAGSVGMRTGRDVVKQITEASNLSVGKILDVTITDGQRQAVVPISVRLMANAIASDSLVHILSHGTEDTSVKERYHAWRAGRLEFIKDLILCNDLVDAKRKHLMKDKDGLYSAITARQRNGFWSTIITGQPSIGMASNLVVMTSATADQLELKTNYQLRNYAQRSKIFESTAVMIMAVIDKEWERITFYHRGIAEPTQLGIRDLKAANRGNGPDVSDILRAYQLGHSPSM